MKMHNAASAEHETTQSTETLNHTVRTWDEATDFQEGKEITEHQTHLSEAEITAQSGSKYHRNQAAHCARGTCNSSSAPEESHNVISNSSEDSHSSADARPSDKNAENNDNSFTPEIQQAYQIFQNFVLEKHKTLTAPFWFPVEDRTGNVCFKTMENKFYKREYESITEFVADFRLLLENCYRAHGVDHWKSKRAQKLELLLEQKLILLPRTLREKTTLALTSRGRFGSDDEKVVVGASNRRRSTTRSSAAMTGGGTESVMVQALRLEELQKAKEEKRLRELEKKEAEEASAKEVEEWESSLLSFSKPWPIETTWELPAIGHFLCLAQAALNLPEIVFFELERCLLMPRCSSFLAKVMTSLLCSPHRRSTLHRRPALPYRRWEAELRQKVLAWYQSVGRAKDQEACAEQLGLCHRLFWTLGQTSPLEEKPFHLLPFNQRVWLLKGLCDNVYETQKDIQDAVLGQPIHECRESILGYDGQENAYVHFPHFCGADLRIYRQSPCIPIEFPLPPFPVKKLEPKTEEEIKVNVSTCLKVKRENPNFFLTATMDDSPQMDCSEESGILTDSDLLRFSCNNEKTTTDGHELEEAERKASDSEPYPRVGKNRCTRDHHAKSADHVKASFGSETDAVQNNSPSAPECHSCLCFPSKSKRASPLFPRQSGNSKAQAVFSKKKRRRKKDRFLCVKKLSHTRAVKTSLHKAAANLNRKDRRRKALGRNFTPKKPGEKKETEPPKLPVEPTFKLVCSNLEELRDLISKTEDELDELESNKKRCGGWHSKKAAVKELHITLIRLLNELLPWEPKLLKAYQRNRARLKKEYDDFKKHPEYENFVREELAAVSGDAGKEGFSVQEMNRESKAQDQSERTRQEEGSYFEKDCDDHIGNEALGRLISGPEVNPDLNAPGPSTRSSTRHPTVEPDEHKGAGTQKSNDTNSVAPEPPVDAAPGDQKTPSAKFPFIEKSADIYQRHGQPIQAMFAKSVGNKVTLISHPQAAVMAHTLQMRNNSLAAALPSTVGGPEPTPDPASRLVFKSAPSQERTDTGPVQVAHRIPDGLSRVINSGTQLKSSVKPVTDQNSSDKVLPQVIILPSNLIVQTSEGNRALQPSSSSSPVVTSKTVTFLSNSHGFIVPENKIPVQHVAPLKDNRPVTASEPHRSPNAMNSGRSIVPDLRSASSTSSSVHPDKCEIKQELKTVCIRDSQSILVTTRGGNTGVVKVQTADKSGAGGLPSSPVFTLAPQFQAFLVSKAGTAESTGQTTTSTKLLPVSSSLINMRTTDNPVPHSLMMTKDPPNVKGSVSENVSKSTALFSGVNPTVLSSSTVSPIQAFAFKTTNRLPQKRLQTTTSDSDPHQKVFLITPTTNAFSTSESSFATSEGSKIRFLSPSGSTCSTVTISKNVEKSKLPAPQSAVDVLKVRPNLGPCSSTTVTTTEVHGINVSGATARILNETKMTKEKTDQCESKILVSSVLGTSSSGLLFVPNSNPVTGPGTSTGSINGRTVTSSSSDFGHSASSLLPSTSTSSLWSNNHSELIVSDSVTEVTRPVLGFPVNKGSILQTGATANKSWVTTSPSTASSTISPSVITSVPMVSQCLGTSTVSCLSSSAFTAAQPSLVRSAHAVGCSSTVQDKVVINTPVPLAPGTQLLINNTRLVVPAPGLSPGSHIVLIPNPMVSSPIHPGTPAPPSQHASARTPAPITPKATPNDTQHDTAGLSLVSSDCAALAKATHLETTSSSGQQNITNVVRLPSFIRPERIEYPVSRSMKGTAAQQHSTSIATSTLSPETSLNIALKPHLPIGTSATPLIPQSSTLASAMSNSASRMQTLPVATVPPNGGSIISHQSSCVATVPPTVNKLVMATCQPIRAMQPRSTKVPVVVSLLPQVKGENSAQVPGGATHPHSY